MLYQAVFKDGDANCNAEQEKTHFETILRQLRNCDSIRNFLKLINIILN